MTKGVIMLEPGAVALPGGLVLVPMVVSADRWVFQGSRFLYSSHTKLYRV